MARPLFALLIAVVGVVSSARAQDSLSLARVPGVTGTLGGDTLVARLRVTHPALQPGGRFGLASSPRVVAAGWAALVRSEVARREAVRSRTGLLTALAVGSGREQPAGVAAAGLLPAAPPTAPPPVEGARPTGPFGSYADLGLRIDVRVEAALDRFRNEACTPFEAQFAGSGCRGGFGAPTIDQQFNVQSGGVVGERLHVNVDFDSQREFDANNDIRVWYEGFPDEILRRVEVGNVTFQAPPSRFVSTGLPANNFGVQATAQLGALEVRGILATQRGNVVRDRVYTVGDVTSQPLDRETRDLDFELGRFFFVVDPAALPGYPGVDILNLDVAALPPPLRVGQVRVYRLRALSARSPSNQNIGGIKAIAISVDSGQRVGPFPWELLLEGRDYYSDPSGAWIALTNRLDDNDYLAVSYVTVDGQDSVGTFPAEAEDTVTQFLRLVYEPKPQAAAAAATFRFEMRNVYRVGSSELVRESVELAVAVNERERSQASDQPYLALFGLAQQNDPSRFDQYNRLFPRQRDPDGGAPIRDYFVVFAHLQPFADSVRLTPAERNDSLYTTPRDLLRTQGPASLYALRMHYEASGAGDRKTLALGAFQIREGSERIFVGQRQLQRDIDYTIAYDVGQVTFTDPNALFAGPAQVRVQFEERAAFDVSPTTVLGLATRYDLGGHGAIHTLALFQRQQSAFTRPPLGLEPSSSFVGSVMADLRFQPNALTRFLDRLPLIETETPSNLALTAEMALSKPNPNQAGQAYLEEFEGEAGLRLSMAQNLWQLGSVPSSGHGLAPYGVDPILGFDSLGAAALTWQNLIINASQALVEFTPRQIDTSIVLVGQTQLPEQILWVALKEDTIGGLANRETGLSNWRTPHRPGVRWRSITQALSPTGLDLSRTEFLEFWVWEDGARTAKNNGAVVVFDFGAVFEDALAVAPDSFATGGGGGGDTTYYGRQPVGLGRLDSERDSLTGTFNAAEDDLGLGGDRPDSIYDATRGVWVYGPGLCSARLAGSVEVFFFADLRSRCSRSNGSVDSEDLDGDSRLDLQVRGAGYREGLVRYVFPVGDLRYYVRDGGMRADANGLSGWRLYRIPFRTDTLLVGEPNLRQMQSLRITVLAPSDQGGQAAPQVFFGLARVRLLGAPWIKRAATPIAGFSGARGTTHGEVVASVVSTENHDLGYTSPPGVINAADRQGASFQLDAQQINERSLRLLARDLRLGERAEAYTRFVGEGDKNFLRYRQLRVWARGRGAGWESGDLEFFIKVGKDEENFYLYRASARTTTWDPEVVIDLGRWLLLRGQVESRWLNGDPPSGSATCGGDSLAYVACDGPYVVQMRTPGIAPPNLARVQELAVGIYRTAQATVVDSAELWVDDIRLANAVSELGTAAAMNLRLNVADFAELAAGVSRRDDQFRQLGEDPTYVSDAVVNLSATVRLERLLPPSWGLAVPFTTRYARTSGAPFYLNRSDLLAEALPGLRTPVSATRIMSLAVRRTRRGEGGWARYLLDPVSASVTGTRADATTELNRSTFSSLAATGDYTLTPQARTVKAAPAFLIKLTDALPGFLRRTELVQSLAGARLRWNPSLLRATTTYNRALGTRFNYQVPVRRASDDFLAPILSATRTWRNDAGVELRPFASSAVRVDLSSSRDLVDYGDTTTAGRLVRQARSRFLGTDVGFERQRSVSLAASATPPFTSWLRPRFALSTSFSGTRDPNTRLPVREQGDTAGAFHLPYSLSNSQRAEIGSTFESQKLARGLFGDSAWVTRLLGRVNPLTVTYVRDRRSLFDRTPFGAPLGFQLPLGGLASFRRLEGVPATSATSTTTWNATTGLGLLAGFRANGSFVESFGTTWALRGGGTQPVRLTQYSREWPSGTLSWTLTPPGVIGRVLVNLTAQTGLRRRLTRSAQFAEAGSLGRASTTSQTFTSVSPSAVLTWARGILTTFDLSRDRTENLAAGNLFRLESRSRSAGVNFAFRPPASVVRLPSDVRVQARITGTNATSCIQRATSAECTTFADTRRTQSQLTLETSIPPSFTAGVQYSRLHSEEVQISRKFTQTVLSAYVTISLAVGQTP